MYLTFRKGRKQASAHISSCAIPAKGDVVNVEIETENWDKTIKIKGFVTHVTHKFTNDYQQVEIFLK